MSSLLLLGRSTSLPTKPGALRNSTTASFKSAISLRTENRTIFEQQETYHIGAAARTKRHWRTQSFGCKPNPRVLEGLLLRELALEIVSPE